MLCKIVLIFIFFIPCNISAQLINNSLKIADKNITNAFPLFTKTSIANLYYDTADATVVSIAAKAFANDIHLISGKNIAINNSNKHLNANSIIVGTIGQSKLIDDLIINKLIDVTQIKNKWESFSIQTIQNKKVHLSPKSPLRGVGGLLIIIGSDRRGTAFGIFHLSRLMGVSPLVYWADVVPTKKTQLHISGKYFSTEPSVQYRGIFINDEDWGLQPWAAKNIDTDIKDIGPKTYAKVFELLLRLKANYIWPAMHPCTKAFYYYKDNPKVANDYAIVVGGSHCEPMLRNNVCEWAETYQEEYNKKPGEWRYDLNKDEIYKYWDDRIKEAVNYESVFTVGMRGVHDGSMPGPKDVNEKVKLLEKVIVDQREILQNNFKKDATKLPQIFVPYKEVLSLYKRGMQLPDDVTIIWPDDNHGYIRQLPNADEQKRTGGHGVYYHLSYWGSPADYLWLSSTSTALIGYEMKKAYNYGAKKLWVFNVGDIKPAELETQFALDMAYNINEYDETNPQKYLNNWASLTFGNSTSTQIATIKQKYYALSKNAKPEHLDKINFTQSDIKKRLKAYANLDVEVAQIQKNIPANLQNAFYQLIQYPVQSANYLNQKIAFSNIAQFYFNRNRVDDAKVYNAKALAAYDSIKTATNYYNTIMADGKWNGIMSFQPRKQKVFDAPKPIDSFKITNDSALVKQEIEQENLVNTFNTLENNNTKYYKYCKLIKGIGICANYEKLVAEINFSQFLPKGNYKIVVKCLPTYAMEKEKRLEYEIWINGVNPQVVNVHAETETATWKENVIRGFSQCVTLHTIDKEEQTKIKVVLRNKNLVINQIEIYKN